MLRELSVQNLATVEDVRIELEPGMLAWTGETGAGKSLLLSALELVLGAKASSQLVRAGKAEARAAAVFEVESPGLRKRVEEILGGSLEDPELILVRRITSHGRGSCHANGMPVTNTVLKRLGACLIDIQGQREGQALLDPDHQRRLVDSYGRHESLLNAYQEARSTHEQLRKRRLKLLASLAERARERDLLEFEQTELTALSPRLGEHDELLSDAHSLSHSESFRLAANEAYSLLYEGKGSAQERLAQVARKLSPLFQAIPALASVAADLDRMTEESRDIARQIRLYADRIERDPHRLEELEERLALYRKLSNRFRCTPDQLEAKQQEVATRLSRIEQDNSDLGGLDAALKGSWRALQTAAEELTSARVKICADLAGSIGGQLKSLSLSEARISILVETSPLGDDSSSPAPPDFGADHVEFLFAPNPGEPPRPLRKIASGGELSRVTLAVRSVLAKVDDLPTLIFDEIDTGVGGRLGAMLGKVLHQLSKDRQVLCITHLPQLACHARHQWVVRKQTRRGQTHTTIRRLDESERVAELAAMMRGEGAKDSTRQEALAMLAEAHAVR